MRSGEWGWDGTTYPSPTLPALVTQTIYYNYRLTNSDVFISFISQACCSLLTGELYSYLS